MARRKPHSWPAPRWSTSSTTRGKSLTNAYDLAFRGLGKITWLHAQSRDGIAAYVAQCWTTGTQPYPEAATVDLQLAEFDRQRQSQRNRRVALKHSAELRAQRDATEDSS